MHGATDPTTSDPTRIHSHRDLVRGLDLLRGRAAGRGKATLDQIAKATAIPRSTVHSYVSGVRLPPADALDAIVQALGVSPPEQAAWADALERVAAMPNSADAPVDRPASVPPTVVPHQLPSRPVHYSGRTGEAAGLDRLVQERVGSTLVAVTGAGGVGKTAFVLHWAHRHADSFPDGELWVDLRGFGVSAPLDPLDALERMLGALGLGTTELPPDVDARAAMFRTAVSGRRMLVVLDNARSSAQVAPLLPGTPGVVTVVTSRDQLRALAVSDGAVRMTLDRLDESQALEVMCAQLPDALRQAVDVSRIVRYCDGLPLALRIMGERLAGASSVEVTGFAEELSGSAERLEAFDLNDSSIDVSMRAVIDWSYLALPPEAARLLRLLPLALLPSVNAETMSVLADLDLPRTRRQLDALISANLLDRSGPDRYRVHDLVAAYARERLIAHEDRSAADAARIRLLDLLVDRCDNVLRATHAARVFRLGPGRPTDPDRGFTSVDDAWAWMIENADLVAAAADDAFAGGSAEHGWLLVDRGSRALFPIGDVLRFERALRAGFALAETRGDLVAAMACAHILGVGYGNAGRIAESQAAFERAIELAGACGDESHGLVDVGNLGQLYSLTGRLDEAVATSNRALDLYTEDGLLFVHITLIETERYRGDFDRAEALLVGARRASEGLDEASPDRVLVDLEEVAIMLGRGDAAGAARRLPSIRSRISGVHASVDGGCFALILAAAAESGLGRLDAAEALAREGLRAARECGPRLRETQALAALGEILLRQGRAGDALVGLDQGLTRAREASLRYQECEMSVLAAEACGVLGDTARARALAASASEIAAACGFRGLAVRVDGLAASVG